jgi:hypothetical protein
MIPAYAMLDVWIALGGDSDAFDRMWDEPRRVPADTWAQLLAVVRRDWATLGSDSNPPCGPEFERLIARCLSPS